MFRWFFLISGWFSLISGWFAAIFYDFHRFLDGFQRFLDGFHQFLNGFYRCLDGFYWFPKFWTMFSMYLVCSIIWWFFQIFFCLVWFSMQFLAFRCFFLTWISAEVQFLYFFLSLVVRLLSSVLAAFIYSILAFTLSQLLAFHARKSIRVQTISWVCVSRKWSWHQSLEEG